VRLSFNVKLCGRKAAPKGLGGSSAWQAKPLDSHTKHRIAANVKNAKMTQQQQQPSPTILPLEREGLGAFAGGW